MPIDANLILLNVEALDSGNDGNGSGSDSTSAPGAVIDVPEGKEAAVVVRLGEPSSDPPADAATLDLGVEVSVDGGSTWKDFITFRQITGDEVNLIDESTGSKTVVLAAKGVLPLADSGQSNQVKLRPTSVASTTTNWAVHMSVVDPTNTRQDWYDEAFVENA